MKLMKITLAIILLLAGFISVPLPFPTGLPLTMVAMVLLLSSSKQAKVKYIRFKRKLQPGTALTLWVHRLDTAIRRKRRPENS